MHQFEVGDRVRITNPNLIHFGKTGVIAAYCEIMCESAWLVRVDGADDSCQYKEASLTPAPDLITINRADLPEVVDGNGGWRVGGFSYASDLTASQRREHAIRLLALAEFLEARDKAAKEAEKEASDKLSKRRDELAKEVAKRACYVNFHNFTYEDHVPATQSAINMLIELEPDRA